MKHKDYKQMIHLALYGELSEDERVSLKQHIESCDECNMEFEQQKYFITMFTENQKYKVDDELLSQARAQLRGRLESERYNKSSILSLRFKVISILSSPTRLAFSAVIILLVGFILGGIFFSRREVISQFDNPVFDKSALSEANTRIANLQFIDSDLSDGEIEFTFDALKRIRLSGRVGDPEIQNVLTYAMLNEQNPGSRLNSINVMESYGNILTDNEVKDALITVLMTDKNPGVRMESMKLINKFSYDESIKQAYLYVLLNDSSAALRISSINALIQGVKDGYHLQQNDIELIMVKAKRDDNKYIRLKSKTLLEEYN